MKNKNRYYKPLGSAARYLTGQKSRRCLCLLDCGSSPDRG